MTDIPNRPPLSPAAQAVADAYDNTHEKPTSNHRYHWLPAALRAAADLERSNPWGARIECAGAMWMRDQLLAIAAELEVHHG